LQSDSETITSGCAGCSATCLTNSIGFGGNEPFSYDSEVLCSLLETKVKKFFF